MPLAIVAAIVILLKLLEIGPPAEWKWWVVLMPLVVLFIWWEFISPLLGVDKKNAERKMAADARAAEESKKKNRGF
jgi:small Trp-rich protein